MKLLTRLAHPGGFDGFSISLLIRSRRSIGLRRSSHLVPSCSGSPREESSDSPAPAAVRDPRWVFLNCREYRRDQSLVADGKTVAEARTSTGRLLRVSFDLAAPPASTILRYDCEEEGAVVPGFKGNLIAVIAAHGDSVLFRMMRRLSGLQRVASDHFVFRAGAGAAAAGRPPSLALLPPRTIPTHFEVEHGSRDPDPACRLLLDENTGLLRRGGGDELLVAQIEVMPGYSERRGVADLCVLRLGTDQDQQWEIRRSVPIAHDEGEKGDELLDCWHLSGGNDKAVAVGCRFLCWVQPCSGFIVWDTAEAAASSTTLRYVSMPVSYDPDLYSDDLPPLSGGTMSMGAAGDGAVRLVAIQPRCCCGGHGRSSCARSRFAFTVTTWTMTLAAMGEPMAWVEDGVLDCEELWVQPGYEGLPRVHLQCPVVSLENPDVVYFELCHYKKVWMIEVDTRRKALLSVCTIDHPFKARSHIQATLQL